jgi:outer membrane lipopolysaccharide assembly protein LptE/RlpB
MRALVLLLAAWVFSFATCRYSTKDTSPIPPEIKTFRVTFFENRARYVNPQLAPQLTERVRQKIQGQTRLRQTNSDDAHYDISGYVTDYSVTTTGVANQNASTNRLNVSFHVVFKNTLDPTKNQEADINRNYDFDAALTLQAAESRLLTQIMRDLTDDIFNKIFSNW